LNDSLISQAVIQADWQQGCCFAGYDGGTGRGTMTDEKIRPNMALSASAWTEYGEPEC
jgi:hypothetical protein